MTPEKGRRLDVVLVERGLAPTRARARDMIRRGRVLVDGATVTRPAAAASKLADIVADDPASSYVSRAALKLTAGLDHFGYDCQGRSVLDIGASTGGFTQVLLERGAAHVTAVDVGHGQLHPDIDRDPRVRNLEGLNARNLEPGHLEQPVTAIVADVSFISLKLALAPGLDLVTPPAWGLFLVKPQFEVGRSGLGKGGIVRDPALRLQAAEDIANWLAGKQGWIVDGQHTSPIAGGDGNVEYLLGARRPG